MEKLVLMIFMATVAIGAINSAMAWEEDGAGVVQVAGKVMCQDCNKGYNEWVQGDRPIKGCKVSLTCMDDRSRVVFYGSDVTDDMGQYEMSVKKYINGKKLNEKLCWVRLVFSPEPSCNVLTDFAGGKTGVKLFRPSYVYRDTVKYLLNTLYFTSPMCERPDTSGDSDDSSTNY